MFLAYKLRISAHRETSINSVEKYRSLKLLGVYKYNWLVLMDKEQSWIRAGNEKEVRIPKCSMSPTL